MGNRYATNKHRVSSAGLYYIHGYRLRLFFDGTLTACWLLVCGAREASTPTAVWRNCSGPDSNVVARGLYLYLDLRALFNLFAALACNPDGSRDRLDCETCLDANVV